ncbi:MAG: LptF/LptG family permease, partial [Verrucomicrobiota bacterium]
SSGKRQPLRPQGQMYVNTIDRRAWYIGQIPFEVDKEALRIIDIFEHDETHRLVRTLQADSAFWNWKNQTWRFENCILTTHKPNGDIEARKKLDHHEVDGWLETPWRIVSERLEATYLGVPKLRSYLNSNQHLPDAQLADHRTFLHHRIAAPWSCLVIAFVATPLGIVFSRRGMMGGVALAIFFFAAILFITELFLALGRTGHIAPILAAWIPNLLFFLIGMGLLFMRTTNRGFDLLSKLRRSVN